MNLNESMDLDIKNNYSFVKSNVGIASAVTSYARIHMIPFKISGHCYYTDTDSVFLDTTIHISQIGAELGLMKDELDGNYIEEAYFLGIKQYGYTYYKNNELKAKSVFAGIARDSISFEDIKKLYNGESITKISNDRFFKSLKNLSGKIKSVPITLKLTNEKKFVNNNYIPIFYVVASLLKLIKH